MIRTMIRRMSRRMPRHIVSTALSAALACQLLACQAEGRDPPNEFPAQGGASTTASSSDDQTITNQATSQSADASTEAAEPTPMVASGAGIADGCSAFGADSMICPVHAETYSGKVGVVIPKSVDVPTRAIVHLHGYQGVCSEVINSPAAMIQSFNMYPEAVVKNLKAVFVVPISKYRHGHPTDLFQTQLVPKFKAFRAAVVEAVKAAKPDAQIEDWIVSGHSAAGSVMRSLFADNPVFANNKAVAAILLDATYGSSGTWKAFGQSWGDTMRIYARYLPGSTAPGGHALAPYGSASQVSGSHCTMVGPHLKNTLTAFAATL